LFVAFIPTLHHLTSIRSKKYAFKGAIFGSNPLASVGQSLTFEGHGSHLTGRSIVQQTQIT
jgi:hypothetical protein